MGKLCCAGAKPVNIITNDAIATPGKKVWLRAKLECKGFLGIRRSVKGEPLSFKGRFAILGTATTNDNGIASILFDVPEEPGLTEYTVKYRGSGRFAPAKSTGRLFVFDSKRPIIICDIDRTIANISPGRFLATPPEKVPTVAGAPTSLMRLSYRCNLIFLTACNDRFAERMQRWMRIKEFPLCPILFKNRGISPIPIEKFRCDTVAELKKVFPKIVAGITHKKSNAKAYVAKGIRAIIISSKKKGVPKGAEFAPDWETVESLLK